MANFFGAIAGALAGEPGPKPIAIPPSRWLSGNPQVSFLQLKLEADSNEARLGARTAYEIVEEGRVAVTQNQVRLNAYIADCTALHRHPDPDEQHRLEQAVERSQALHKQAAARNTDANHKADAAARVEQRCGALIKRLAAAGELATPVPWLPVKGTARDVINASLKTIASLKADKRATKDAPVAAADAEAKLIAELDGLAAKAMPPVTFVGGPALAFPWTPVAAEARNMGDEPPRAFDPRPLTALLLRDQIVASIQKAVAEHYADVPLALSAKDKVKRIAALDAQILAEERLLAGAVWLLREEGINEPFPGDIDPRAVLGISGPVIILKDDLQVLDMVA